MTACWRLIAAAVGICTVCAAIQEWGKRFIADTWTRRNNGYTASALKNFCQNAIFVGWRQKAKVLHCGWRTSISYLFLPYLLLLMTLVHSNPSFEALLRWSPRGSGTYNAWNEWPLIVSRRLSEHLGNDGVSSVTPHEKTRKQTCDKAGLLFLFTLVESRADRAFNSATVPPEMNCWRTILYLRHISSRS